MSQDSGGFERILQGFDQWLGTSDGGSWSLTNLTDAQKESLLWVGTSFILIIVFWRGIPFGYRWGYVCSRDDYRYKPKLRFVPILEPVKYLTVLFHEISHAIVGTLTGGRVIAIVISWNEGGSTHFRDPHAVNLTATWAAGYIGSCLIGCIFVILGFDTLASKYAFIFFELLAVVCLLFCLSTFPKSWLHHRRHRIREYWHRMLGNLHLAQRHKQNAEAQQRHEKENGPKLDHHHHDHPNRMKGGPSAEEMKVSAEAIIFTNGVIATVVGVTWWLADSIYLRFIILFIGIMNAMYAIWDIYLDGIKFNMVHSDITRLVDNLKEIDDDEERCSLLRRYAIAWLTFQTALLIMSIVIALFVWQETIAEQAVQSRRFLPSPNHYGPADLIGQASDSIKDAFD